MLRHVIETVGLVVLRDIASVEPDFPLLDTAIGLVERQSSAAKTLDLAPHQGDSAFEGVEDLVVVSGPPVFRDDLLGLGFPLLPAGGRRSGGPSSGCGTFADD